MMASPLCGPLTAAHEYFIPFQSRALFSSNLQVTAHNDSLEIFQDLQEY